MQKCYKEEIKFSEFSHFLASKEGICSFHQLGLDLDPKINQTDPAS